MTTAGPARAGRPPRWRRLLAGLALALALAPGFALATAATATPAGAASPGCGTAAGPFTVQGSKVLGRDGRVFASYGITVPGLQGLDWRRFARLDLQKIAAIADYWCANTVRLQLNQDINPRTWSCLPDHEPQPGQGAGALVMAWFRQHDG